ncbi:MAG: response regulator transcription factor [Rhodospirillales bacterium]|nr:response regulator transcription factor [Rhodospirillales bacterium]
MPSTIRGWSVISLFKSLDASAYDCHIIDLSLPDQDGIVLVRKVRARSKVPIIVLTGRDQIEDKIASFELGTDEYIVKPVDLRELKMRLRLVLQRAEGKSCVSERVKIGPVTLDYSSRSVVRDNGRVIDLTPAEFLTI